MTNLRPEMVHIAEMSRRSGISQRTIHRFINAGLECEHSGRMTLIDIYHFLKFVHEHYRYKRIGLRQGKRWGENELTNPTGRTPNAIRLKIYRDIQHQKRK